MNSTRIKIIFCLLAIFFGLLIFSKNTTKSTVFLGGKLFSVEIAKTEATRERGLSGHKPLLDNEAMLFVFPKPDFYSFWMKDMTFPIDIIWIDQNMTITHIENSLSPTTYPTTFESPQQSLYVLEVSAGEAEKLGIKVGDRVNFSQKSF
jgi:uncharacterized membrane protein (UPF0127 family)